MLKPIMPAFAGHRQDIAIDLRGHGDTELGKRKISLPDLGDDPASVLAQLGYKNVDVLRYSFGGGVAFRLAAQHPEMVRRLALVSAGCLTLAIDKKSVSAQKATIWHPNEKNPRRFPDGGSLSTDV